MIKNKSINYIFGMTEEEFKAQNPDLRPMYEDINNYSKVERILLDEVYYHEKENKIISWLFFGAFSYYYFYLINDTLLEVHYGFMNADIKKEIDYSNYSGSKAE